MNENDNLYQNVDIELIRCSYCRKNVDAEEINRTKAGTFACDNCYDPNDREQQSDGNNSPSVENTQKTSNFNSSNTFTSEDEKDKEKAIEILNVDELNAKVEIPKELNIVDC